MRTIMNATGSGGDVDGALTAVADRRRRAVVRRLRARATGGATLEGLAESLAGTLGDDPDRVAVELHHRHLPKLDDLGVVEYDARSHRVRYRGDESVEALLRFLDDRTCDPAEP
jgi:hypothetical protein